MEEIKLTDVAKNKVKEIMEQEGKSPLEWCLRITVEDTSNGLSYGLDFDKATIEDVVFNDDDLSLVIKKEHLPLFAGSVIDYIVAPDGEGFIITNPMGGGCGCGGSCSCG